MWSSMPELLDTWTYWHLLDVSVLQGRDLVLQRSHLRLQDAVALLL